MIPRRLIPIALALAAWLPLTGCFGEPEPQCSQAVAGSECNPDDPGAVYRVNECGEYLDTLKTCPAGTVCGPSELIAGRFDCVEDPDSCEGDDYEACNPDDPGAIYTYNKCDEVVGVDRQCDAGELCEMLGNVPTCKRDPDDCRNDSSYRECNPDDPSAIYEFDGCGEVIGIDRQCDPGEFCELLGNVPTCKRDLENCINEPDYKECNPDDPSAIYEFDGCGEVIGIDQQCADDEICSKLGNFVQCDADPEDCRNAPSRSGCNPDDLSAIWRIDGCGMPFETIRNCGAGEICEERNGRGYCVDDCRDPQAAKTCNRADPTAIYWENSCGEIGELVEQCDVTNFEVCDDSSGTPQCVRDCGSEFAQKVCKPGDLDYVYYANECGEVSDRRAATCLAIYGKVCGDDGGEARCVDGCGDPQTGTTCTLSDPTAVYWTDRCGNRTTKKMDCNAANFEECKTIGGVAQCVRDCGSDFAQRVCDPTQPDGRFYANECGEITQRFWTCDTADFEVCDDSSGTAKCVQDCGTDMMAQQVCDPREPSAIYWADRCGNPTTKQMDCPALHECDDSSGTPTCTLNCGGSTRDHEICDPSNPGVIAWANLCGNIVGVSEYCRSSNFEVCDDSSGTPQCVRDCGSSQTDIVCNPADTTALYYANGCGEVTTKFQDCDAANFEVCDDSSGAATCTRDCGSDYAQKACNPADPTAIYYANACGEITNRLRTCDTSDFEVCDDSSGTPQCVQDCGSPTTQTACDPSDPTAIYNANACGDITTKLQDCDASNFEVCDDSSGVAQCVRDCGSSYAQKVCIPGDYDNVYYANECGDITGTAQRCLAIYGQVCSDASGQARCDDGCGDPQTSETCNPNDPTAIYWADRCGGVTTKKTDCDTSNFEVCKTVGGTPQCVRECGSSYAQKVCDPNDPTAIYYANECGDITTRGLVCNSSRLEQCDDSSGEARCVPQCGGAMEQQVCDPNDRGAIYWADLCGNVTTKVMDCPTLHTCDDSSGTPTCTLDCGNSRERKVCDPNNPGVVAWANLCGEITATYDYCSSSNFEVCDDSSGTAQCTRDCGADTAQTACDPADPTALYYANGCGEVTTKLADCDTSNFEVCDDSSGTALCVQDCGSRYAQKVCNPADTEGIYYANECGEITQRYRGCDTSNFEICDDSSGTPTCVQECGGDMERQVCDPNDTSAIYWADRCGNVTTKVMDCPAMHSCDSSGAMPTCTLDCGGDREMKVCDPNDPVAVYWADACGNPTTRSISCSASNFEVCDDSSGEAQCVQDCGGDREQLVCDPNDAGAVYYADRCGNITTKAADCDAANFEVCDDSSGDAICARDCGSNSDHKECDPDDPSAVYWANGCGEITSKFTDCNNGKQCAPDSQGSVSCLCVPTDEVACFGTNQLYSPSGIAVVDSCGITTDQSVEDCINGEVCREIDGAPTCWSSVLDKTSPYYIRGCTLNLYLDAPTDLPMDCRCRRATSGTGFALGEGIIQCWPIGTSWNRGHRYANGPHFYPVSTNRQAGGGVLDPTTGKLYFAFNWSDGTYTEAGMIGVFDYETGDREVLSGLYKDPSLGYQTYGSGHVSARYNSTGGQLEVTTMPYIQDVELGADGYLYALSSDTATNVEITRVDKVTGERTLMWKREVPGLTSAFGQCRGPRADPSYATGYSPVQYSRRAFALDPQGNYYLAFANGFDGMGVVKISSDGSTCTILSRSSSSTPMDAPNIGGGYTPQYSTLRGMLWRNDKLYAYASLSEQLIEYDTITGDRVNFSEPGVVGLGAPILGQTTMWYDSGRSLIMTAGGASPYSLVAVDPATGDRQDVLRNINVSQPLIPGAYPAGQGQPLKGALDNGNAVQWGAVAPDPDDPDKVYFVLIQGALVQYEISTGNSYVMSL